MDERTILAVIASLMVLVILVGGLARRRMPQGQALRLGAIWLAIIAGATVAVTIVERWIG